MVVLISILVDTSLFQKTNIQWLVSIQQYCAACLPTSFSGKVTANFNGQLAKKNTTLH